MTACGEVKLIQSLDSGVDNRRGGRRVFRDTSNSIKALAALKNPSSLLQITSQRADGGWSGRGGGSVCSTA